jgi:hypothetical protein
MSISYVGVAAGASATISFAEVSAGGPIGGWTPFFTTTQQTSGYFTFAAPLSLVSALKPTTYIQFQMCQVGQPSVCGYGASLPIWALSGSLRPRPARRGPRPAAKRLSGYRPVRCWPTGRCMCIGRIWTPKRRMPLRTSTWAVSGPTSLSCGGTCPIRSWKARPTSPFRTRQEMYVPAPCGARPVYFPPLCHAD